MHKHTQTSCSEQLLADRQTERNLVHVQIKKNIYIEHFKNICQVYAGFENFYTIV